MIDVPHPRDRAGAIRWAQRLASDPATLFLDTEATGLGASEVIELALVRLDGSVLVDQLIRPREPIPVESIFIHGIGNRDVADAPAWSEVIAPLGAHLEASILVAYNAATDRAAMEHSCNVNGTSQLKIGWACAMRAFTAFRRGSATSPRGNGWHSLTTAASTMGISIPTHRALSDANVCRQIVIAMANAAPLESG